MTGEFDYINRTYGLTLKRGSRCIYTGDGAPRFGSVVSSNGSHIRIRFDDDGKIIRGPFHPTWKLRHVAPPTEANPQRDTSTKGKE